MVTSLGTPRAVSSQGRKIDLSQQRCNRGASAREMFTRNTNIVVRQRPRPRNEQWPLCSCTSTARPSKPCACRCGRSPATPVRRSGAGSSLIGLRQDRDIALTVGSAAELLPPLEQLAAVRRETGKDTTKEYALSNASQSVTASAKRRQGSASAVIEPRKEFILRAPMIRPH